MHASSMENMQLCYDLVKPLLGDINGALRALEVGSLDVNGSYRHLLPADASYIGADLESGANVDVVLDVPYELPFADSEFDLVLSGQMLEHNGQFWRTFREMVRVTAGDGFVFLIAPSAGPIHRFPVDCYRFYPDAYASLAEDAGCHLVWLLHDERGPWNDLVGVFAKRSVTLPLRPTRSLSVKRATPAILIEEHEQRRGRRPYLEVLEEIHHDLMPRSYLEIGVRDGDSLRLARCYAVGVDPDPGVQSTGTWQVYAESSDDFFRFDAADALSDGIDLAFIDGMHLFEYALRDFMNIERLGSASTVVVIDDVLPNHPVQAQRDRVSVAWCGDVWKLTECLQRYRPDLHLLLLDTHPAGTLLVAGLDPTNRVLWDRYNPIVGEFIGQPRELPPTVISRSEALDPADPRVTELLRAIRDERPEADHAIRAAIGGAASSPTVVVEPTIQLSLVVVAFDMARELPRTLRSLSPLMQRGISSRDYEIVVVDNGSLHPVDREACSSFGGTVRYLEVTDASVSPCRAANLGLAHARAPFVGVCIDGARMASPGLLSQAVAGGRLSSRAVVATLAFHLGPDVQMRSVLSGYDAEAEDELLRSIAWEEDGYRLFDVSVFAGSSAGGWFATPSESNALFMQREMWTELGGYDEAFEEPGGGIVNLDTFNRACELDGAQLVLLLGEGTFHQVHGGVATNAVVSPLSSFYAEYERIRGRPYRPTDATPIHLGAVGEHVRRSMLTSVTA